MGKVSDFRDISRGYTEKYFFDRQSFHKSVADARAENFHPLNTLSVIQYVTHNQSLINATYTPFALVLYLKTKKGLFLVVANNPDPFSRSQLFVDEPISRGLEKMISSALHIESPDTSEHSYRGIVVSLDDARKLWDYSSMEDNPLVQRVDVDMLTAGASSIVDAQGGRTSHPGSTAR